MAKKKKDQGQGSNAIRDTFDPLLGSTGWNASLLVKAPTGWSPNKK